MVSHAYKLGLIEAQAIHQTNVFAAGKKKVLLFNLPGHSRLDLSSYESYPSGKIQDI